MIRLDDIEAKAKAAQSWCWYESDQLYEYLNVSADANFIAATNPDTILALVRIARAAKDMIKEWEDSYENHGFLFSVEVETRIKEALRGVE